MNKEDIKKALTCCKEDCCSYCPHWCEKGCQYQTLSDALILITEQEKEINNLKDDYAKLQELFAKYQTASDKEILAQVKQAKIEVLNKLRERVETAIDAYFNLDGGGYYLAEGAMNDIDELLKEYEE